VVVNLLSAAAPDLSQGSVQRIVTQADATKQGKADEILRYLHDHNEAKINASRIAIPQ